jgi:hypothetical protein
MMKVDGNSTFIWQKLNMDILMGKAPVRPSASFSRLMLLELERTSFLKEPSKIKHR